MDIEAVRPVLKPSRPVFGTPALVRIGGYGSVIEIPDDAGQIRRLLQLLDGTRTVAQVWTELLASDPGLTIDDVRAAIAQFDAAGLLVDAADSADGILDDYELRRWERNVNYFASYAAIGLSSYQLQARLRDCRITLIGLGGLGTQLLLNLAAMGVGRVRVVDHDRVEISNLNRQILYREADLGKLKLDIAVRRVREFNPRIELEPVAHNIGSTEDVLDVVGDADFVISVADRPGVEIIHWVNAGCVQAGVPFVSGGLDTQRAVYYTILPGITGCVECWRITIANDDPTAVALRQRRRDLGLGGDNAAFAPLAMMVSGFILGELTHLVTGIAPPVAAGRLMQLRFDEFTEAERWSRRPDCPVCGSLSGPPAERWLAAAANS